MRIHVLCGVLLVLGAAIAAQQAINPRQQPGAIVHIFAPEQHDLYDGHFVISANRHVEVGPCARWLRQRWAPLFSR